MIPACDRVFSMKYPARRCRTFRPLNLAQFRSISCSPAMGPVLSGLSAPMLLSVTACFTAAFSSALAIAVLARLWNPLVVVVG